MEVFILGYPFEIKPPAYPVWKRGSIASEPQLARLATDYMLVEYRIPAWHVRGASHPAELDQIIWSSQSPSCTPH